MMTNSFSPQTIGILGGGGKLGSGLGFRWAKAGHRVLLGSREPSRAEAAADAIRTRIAGDVRGAGYDEVIEAAQILVLSVPFDAQAPTLETLREKIGHRIIIDTTVALRPPAVGRVQLPVQGSAGLIARASLAGAGRLVCAFQNVAAGHLTEDHDIACDVLVTTDDSEAFEVVEQLARDAGMRALHAGPIENSVAIEAMTSVLITLNRRYRSPGTGLHITGLPAT